VRKERGIAIKAIGKEKINIRRLAKYFADKYSNQLKEKS
jgi:hypothetical protein